MKRGGAVLAAVLGVLSAGCLIHVDRVSDPRPAFREAHREAARLEGRAGPVHHLNILAYDPDDAELVRIRLPIWLVRELDDDDLDIDLDRDWDCAVRVRRRLCLEDIEKAGLGILLEAREDDGERVLIWVS